MAIGERGANESTFEEDLAFHLGHGMVFGNYNTGDFVMARGVNSKMPELFETYHVFNKEECDAWFVWTAVGNLNNFARLLVSLTEVYPKVIRRAKGKIREADVDKILKLNNIYYGK